MSSARNGPRADGSRRLGGGRASAQYASGPSSLVTSGSSWRSACRYRVGSDGARGTSITRRPPGSELAHPAAFRPRGRRGTTPAVLRRRADPRGAGLRLRSVPRGVDLRLRSVPRGVGLRLRSVPRGAGLRLRSVPRGVDLRPRPGPPAGGIRKPPAPRWLRRRQRPPPARLPIQRTIRVPPEARSMAGSQTTTGRRRWRFCELPLRDCSQSQFRGSSARTGRYRE